jgi:hypothetical protein
MQYPQPVEALLDIDPPVTSGCRIVLEARAAEG